MTTILANFEITGWDEQPYDDASGAKLARVTVRKRFGGDLDGESVAELLTARTDGPGAGYVACERIAATIAGRSGTFVLQHAGVGDPTADPFQFALIVPGSGTGELAAIAGTGRYEHTAQLARLTLDVTF